MTFAEVHVKRSVILTDRLGPDILLVLTMKRQVLHRERAHLKVPGCSLVLSALLTKKFPTFLSRLNEISGCAQNSFSRNIMRITIRAMCQKRIALDKQILHCRSELSKICPAILVQSIRAKIRQLNSGLFDHLHQTKTLKLQQLIGPQITDDTTLHSHNTVITIPENLPLTDSEKSVLSKGLNFVPITKRTNEFSIKQDVEKFLRRVQLKAFFHDKEDDSDTSNKDIFETLLVRKSKWTPPEGQFASLDFFTKKCRHAIHKLKLNRNTKFSNLSSEE